MEYRGSTRGSGALPSFFLATKYDEFYHSLETFRAKIDRDQIAHREAIRAIGDAEALLNYIFI